MAFGDSIDIIDYVNVVYNIYGDSKAYQRLIALLYPCLHAYSYSDTSDRLIVCAALLGRMYKGGYKKDREYIPYTHKRHLSLHVHYAHNTAITITRVTCH